MRRLLFALLLLSYSPAAQAQVPAGTWIKRGESPLAMVVEPAGAGIKISYKTVGPDRKPRLYGTSKSELSADGKTLKVESEVPENSMGQPAGKMVEYWDKQ